MGNKINIGEELEISLNEAILISKGELEPYKTTVYELVDVKALRAKLGVTQNELAKSINVSTDTVKSWEQGRRNPIKLAQKVLRLFDKEPHLYAFFAAD